MHFKQLNPMLLMISFSSCASPLSSLYFLALQSLWQGHRYISQSLLYIRIVVLCNRWLKKWLHIKNWDVFQKWQKWPFSENVAGGWWRQNGHKWPNICVMKFKGQKKKIGKFKQDHGLSNKIHVETWLKQQLSILKPS